MPDGDKVHAKLRFFYQNAYKQLCEDVFDPEDVARELLRAVKNSIRYDGGQRPFRMIESVAANFEQLPQEPIAKQLVNWVEESCALEKVARLMGGKKRVNELALRTCKEQLHHLRNNVAGSGDTALEMHNKYLSNLYQSEFEQRIPLAEHYNGVSQETVDLRLDSLRPHVTEGLAKFAEQIKRRGDAASLRMPNRENVKKVIDLHATDLLAGF